MAVVSAGDLHEVGGQFPYVLLIEFNVSLFQELECIVSNFNSSLDDDFSSVNTSLSLLNLK
jgi:hypothetical protein